MNICLYNNRVQFTNSHSVSPIWSPFHEPVCDVIYQPGPLSSWEFIVSLIFIFRFLTKMNKEFKRRQLRSMNKALRLTGQALSKITPDRKRCLDAVARCQPLIAWLKGTISGDFRNKFACNCYLQLFNVDDNEESV